MTAGKEKPGVDVKDQDGDCCEAESERTSERKDSSCLATSPPRLDLVYVYMLDSRANQSRTKLVFPFMSMTVLRWTLALHAWNLRKEPGRRIYIAAPF